MKDVCGLTSLKISDDICNGNLDPEILQILKISNATYYRYLEWVRENPDIEVVISDMKMPMMNGLEYIRKINDKHSNISCYILTGYGLIPEINEAIKEELILDCLSKPFEMEKIDQELQSVLNK